MEDLTHLVGPLTEESIVRCLQARFHNSYCETLIGPHLVCINPCDQYTRPPHTILQAGYQSHFLGSLIRRAVSQHAETGQSQVIIVSGESGSGKTHYAMSVLRQLYCAAGGGPETDAYKYLSAAITVLAALTSAAIPSNPDSSRVGMYVENLTSDCLIYRTKLHCLFVDQGRVTHVAPGEKNYHIFYYMLAGLSAEERMKLHLSGHSMQSFRYLGDCAEFHTRHDAENNMLFDSWKSALAMLGIPVWDVLRVLAAILLLGNIQFVDTAGMELELMGNDEMKAVAALLGVPGVSLYRGFSTRTRDSHGQLCRTITDAKTANTSRDILARALYYRTLGAVLRSVNSFKRRTSHCTQSTESLDSRNSTSNINSDKSLSDPVCQKPYFPSYVGDTNAASSSDGFLGVLDFFGFQQAEVNGLEQLCSNLCAEAMQHYYNSHIFRGPNAALSDEGLSQQVDVQFFNNTPVIQLISAQSTGILNLVDRISLQPNSDVKALMREVKTCHTTSDYFFEPLQKTEQHMFGIRHFTGRVVYNASSFLSTNLNPLPDDVVRVFSPNNCNFGFVSYLFAAELKGSLGDSSSGGGLVQGAVPAGPMESSSPRESEQTLCTNFQRRLENLLKSIAPARPHFIRCLRSMDHTEVGVFEAECVLHQIRSLQVTPTVQLMAEGLPHRLRYRAFNSSYGLFLPASLRNTGSSQDECQMILSQFLRAMDESHVPYVSTRWMLGRKHIFFSEGTRQCLEAMREESLNLAATCIQASWRGFRVRTTQLQQPAYLRHTAFLAARSPRPSLPPRGERIDTVEPSILLYLSQLNGMDLVSNPRYSDLQGRDLAQVGPPRSDVLRKNTNFF